MPTRRWGTYGPVVVTPRRRPPEPLEPIASAREAGLHYVNDGDPGYRRQRAGRGFVYTDTEGRRIIDAGTLTWIRSIVIPPAWTDVWISPVRNGHILATGRDARGRKQYRYHPRWIVVRDETKYGRLLEFGTALPGIRERVDTDLGRAGLPREKVLAAVVRLLELTSIRVGNEEYARLNRSFGLTTLRDNHVRIQGTRIRFRFRGKSGKVHETGIRDRRLATVIQRCQDLPGQVLFQYLDDDGVRQSVDSADVNAYLREITGQDITAKDFRTWAGTLLTFCALSAMGDSPSPTDGNRNIVAAIKDVALRLGNTPAVCRASYVHPAVLDAYLDGDLPPVLARSGHQSGATDADVAAAAVLALLRLRLRRKRAAAAEPHAASAA